MYFASYKVVLKIHSVKLTTFVKTVTPSQFLGPRLTIPTWAWMYLRLCTTFIASGLPESPTQANDLLLPAQMWVWSTECPYRSWQVPRSIWVRLADWSTWLTGSVLVAPQPVRVKSSTESTSQYHSWKFSGNTKHMGRMATVKYNYVPIYKENFELTLSVYSITCIFNCLIQFQ